MKYKYLLLAAGLMAASPAAWAQDTVATTTTMTTANAQYMEIDDDDVFLQEFGMTVDELEDVDVIGPNGEEIGEVEEALTDANGKLVALSVEAGGFLGIGEKEVVIGLDQVRFEGGKILTSFTEEQLEALPEWD